MNWEALKPNIDGAIIRCGYGDDLTNQDDKQWARNVKECERLGIPYGVYLYSYAINMSHAQSEVKHALRLLKGHKPSFPVYFDTENQGCESMSYRASDYFCEQIEKAGYKAGIYTFETWYNAYLKGLKKYSLWIAKFGVNDGKAHEKPNIGTDFDAWQFTSMGKIKGYSGRLDVSYFYNVSDTKKADVKTELIDVADVAATIHADMCNDAANGYSWNPRWGEDGLGVKKLTIGGRAYQYDRGSYDCSSSVITACNEALRYTKHKDALKAATYTGNMLEVFTKSGLFEKWNTSKTIAKRGDVYLNYANHTAMCQDDEPDTLSEFSISETGGTSGKVGDQTGKEACIHGYYNYPWNCTLHWKGKLEAKDSKPKETLAFRISTDKTGKTWLAAGKQYKSKQMIRWIAIKGAGKYQVCTRQSGWLPIVDKCNVMDFENGCAGDGSPIIAVRVLSDDFRYAVRVDGVWYADMVGMKDTSGTKDTFAGDLIHAIDGFRIERNA